MLRSNAKNRKILNRIIFEQFRKLRPIKNINSHNHALQKQQSTFSTHDIELLRDRLRAPVIFETLETLKHTVAMDRHKIPL
ncbi:MAG TPA: hypothetical protein DHW36_01860 [Thalassospira sp.]|nr:hypothetical protein [Thalassospira sp.]